MSSHEGWVEVQERVEDVWQVEMLLLYAPDPQTYSIKGKLDDVLEWVRSFGQPLVGVSISELTAISLVKLGQAMKPQDTVPADTITLTTPDE